MKVNYKKDMLSKILDEQLKAREQGKEIESIEVTQEEWDELVVQTEGFTVSGKCISTPSNECEAFGIKIIKPACEDEPVKDLGDVPIYQLAEQDREPIFIPQVWKSEWHDFYTTFVLRSCIKADLNKADD